MIKRTEYLGIAQNCDFSCFNEETLNFLVKKMC